MPLLVSDRVSCYVTSCERKREGGRKRSWEGRKEGGLMESILLWTGQNDQLQVMRMDHAGKKIAARERE